MDVSADLMTPATPEELFVAVDTLDGYERWLDIVARVDHADPAEGDPGPAWLVELRGQLGPFRRSKRLRMVRFVHNPPHRVQYTRREVDGKAHSRWTLTGDIAPEPDGSRLTMQLHYGGGLWVPGLDRLLADEIVRSKAALLEHLAEQA